MTEKCIIFFDIDGTLYDHEKKLPSSTKEAIFTLQERGHEVAIATGRGPFMFEGLRAELGIGTFVSYNGQYVVCNNEVLYTNPMNEFSMKKLAALAYENDDPLVFMNEMDMKASLPDHENVIESIESLKINQLPSHDPHFYKKSDIYQCLLFCDRDREGLYENKFTDFDFIRWHQLSIDVLPQGGSKAIGIRKIAEKLGFPPDRQYAFGDGLNDIDMLTEVRNSVAMGNAYDQVKAVARHVTKSVEDDGIYYALGKLGLI